jgi:hypothetical protein
LKSDFTHISQKWSPYWHDVSRATFVSLPWKSRSQHDLAAKSCPVHYFVIWSRILQLFHKNDHHIETMCCKQYLCCFYTLNFVCGINLTQQEVYLPVSKTYSQSITRFNRLLFYKWYLVCLISIKNIIKPQVWYYPAFQQNIGMICSYNYLNYVETVHINSLSIMTFLCSPKNFGGAYSRRLVRPSVVLSGA